MSIENPYPTHTVGPVIQILSISIDMATWGFNKMTFYNKEKETVQY